MNVTVPKTDVCPTCHGTGRIGKRDMRAHAYDNEWTFLQLKAAALDGTTKPDLTDNNAAEGREAARATIVRIIDNWGLWKLIWRIRNVGGRTHLGLYEDYLAMTWPQFEASMRAAKEAYENKPPKPRRRQRSHRRPTREQIAEALRTPRKRF